MKKIVIITLFALSLQSCVFVVGAAAGAGIAVVVYDHRKIQNIHEDQTTTNEIIQRLNSTPGMRENTHINVTTFNHVTLLTGEAISSQYREQVGAIAQSVNGVSRLYNQITVGGLSSQLSRTSDAWITTKIKTQMLAMKDLKSTSIKVVTENGVVYLMGIVSRDQAENAVDIARQVSGVQKVIRIFQYTDGNTASNNSSAESSGLGQPQQLSDNSSTQPQVNANPVQANPTPTNPVVAKNDIPQNLAAQNAAAENSTQLLEQGDNANVRNNASTSDNTTPNDVVYSN